MDAVLEVSVLTTEDDETIYETYNDFLYARAESMCAADGPRETINCVGLEQVQQFTTASGISGTVFYLTEERRELATGATMRNGKGPFFAFNMSDLHPEERYTALVIRPPIALAADAVDSNLIRSVAESVEFTAPITGQ
jgi:hypothetical protein